MLPKNHTIYLLLMLLVSAVFSQDLTPESSENVVDSLIQARKEKYEATLKFIQEMRRRREKDPQRYADSVAQVKSDRRFKEAQKRFADYQNQDLSNLEELDLSGGRLKSIPKWVYQAKSMEVLILDYNSISRLPKNLNDLPTLKRIYWRYNELENGKLKAPRLDSIRKLDISGNGLEKLPRIHRLKNLEELVVENNSLTKLPTWRGRRLKSLKELDLSQNPLTIDRRWYGLLDHIEILRLNKCNIREVHPNFYRMDGLKELLIQVNELEQIPPGISALIQLNKLSFYKNNLSSLPDDFYELDSLEIIDLYYNDFESISSRISNLKNLRILYLSFNELYDIPEEIGELSNLEELYVHHNRLSEIPKKYEELKNLKVFHIQNNYIPDFPDQVLSMENLIDLDISETDIRTIPHEITGLKLDNFYWRNLDINLNDLDHEETLSALMQLMENGTNVVPSVSIATMPD
ncbi:leucine-rich repeat domain-containing protein [Ekhidna sp.]|uniref:leucine-rich repeat domain-containing protein n=1 Tax=Ekhidna sp. TaxID=2608089 RepID=UPI003CCC0C26